MTLPSSGAISLNAIADEFGLARSTAFPSGFYGKGGAPASGALSFADFYGRSNVAPSPLAASASPTSVDGTGINATVTTPLATANPTGGTGPYTYAWSKVSGGNITIVNPTSASTRFQGAGMAVNEQRSAIFRCVVTDAANATATTNDVSASVTRDNNA